MGRREHSFLFIILKVKTSNFHSPQNWEEWEGMKLYLKKKSKDTIRPRLGGENGIEWK